MSRFQRLVVLVGVLLIVGYVLLPVQKSLYLRVSAWDLSFGSGPTDGVRLLINDQAIDGDQIVWSLGRWSAYYDPELTPAAWPPPDTPPPHYDPQITESLRYEVRVRAEQPASQGLHTVFVRIVDGDDVSSGAFRLRAVDSDGRSAKSAGCRLESKSVGDKHIDATVEIRLQL